MKKKILQLIISLSTIALSSCNTPAVVIYQQGVGIGNNKIKVTETKHLNKVITIYEGKCDSGQKVIIKQKLY